MAFGELNRCYVGSRVRVTVSDGAYYGILNAIDINTPVKRLTLEKIVSCQTGKKISGLQNFFSREIQKVEIIEDNRKKAQKRLEDSQGPMLITKRQGCSHLSKLKPLDTSTMLLQKMVNKDLQDTGPPIVQIKKLSGALEKKTEDQLAHQDWPSHYLLISKNDQVFSEAMIHIQKQTTIGLTMEGTNMGRRGTISFVQVGTRSYVFVFDLLELGNTLFEEGLKQIIEHPNIQKVMHDCRWASDALFHQHGVKLINVFDTAVSDMIVYKNRHCGDVPRYLQSISCLLITHLDFNSNDVNWHKMRSNALQSDQKVWMMRPAPQRVLIVAVRYVMYLVQLRVAMMEAMLEEFKEGVNVFLSTVRDAPEERLNNLDKNRHLLPERMSKNLNYQDRYKNQFQPDTYTESQRDPLGRRENCSGSLDTNIIFSNDSIWHQGSGTHIQGLSTTQALQECTRKGTFFQYSGDLRARQYLSSLQKKPADPAYSDEGLMALGERKLAAAKNAPPQPEPEKQPSEPVSITRSIPAGYTSASLDFPSYDIRIQQGQKPAIESDDVIPCYTSLVKADSTKHSTEPTTSQEMAGGDLGVLGSQPASGLQPTSEADGAASSVAQTKLANPRPALLGRGIAALKAAMAANAVGAAAAAAAGDGASSSDSSGSNFGSRVPSGRGIGRGVLKLLIEKDASFSRQAPAPSTVPGQFAEAD